MVPLRQRNGNQYLHRQSDRYRGQVKRKVGAYHVFIQAGVVAQGLLQYLAVVAPKLVWDSFGSWHRLETSQSLRTMQMWAEINTLRAFCPI
jgi:hypothetical protein